MPKKAGRPPLERNPKSGIYKVLSDNLKELLEAHMALRDKTMTDAAHEVAGKKMSANTILRAYSGRNNTGIEALEKIAEAFGVGPGDLITAGACHKILNTRMSRSPSVDEPDKWPSDDARTLHRPRRQ